MSAAACKIILCLGALAKEIALTMTATHEDAGETIIAMLESVTDKINQMRDSA